ncbi:hypothetical protein [Streptomyces agglomeratus]|nr:hypothetical protein [Streptomyces agglomeratus]
MHWPALIYEFLLRDVLGSTIAALLASATTWGLTKLRDNRHRPPNNTPPE